MHHITYVKHIHDYKLIVIFEDEKTKLVDLEEFLGKGVFKPLLDVSYFKKVRVNQDIGTIVWDNEADFSPDFLYEIGKEL